MEKAEIRMFGKVMTPIKEEKTKFIKPMALKKALKEIALYLGGLLCGSAVVLSMFNPIGVAYVSAFLADGIGLYFMAAVVGIGYILSGTLSIFKYGFALILLMLCGVVFEKRMKEKNAYFRPSAAAFSVCASGAAYALFNGGSTYLLFVSFVEGIIAFCLSVMMDRGVAVFKDGISRKLLTSDEAVSLSLIIVCGIAGMSGIYKGELPIEIAFCSLAILAAGFKGGTGPGTAVGVLMGFVLMLCGVADMKLFCVFSVSGMLCGAMKDMGRLAALISYICGVCILSFYLELMDTRIIVGVIASGIAFLLIPKRMLCVINMAAGCEKAVGKDEYYARMKGIVSMKLNGFAKGFHALERTFEDIAKENEQSEQKEAVAIIDRVVSKVCKGCGLKVYCWETSFYNTYQTIFTVLSVCEKRGGVTLRDIPSSFGGSCVKLEAFVNSVNSAYELYREGLIWENRLNESRQLVSQQLGAMADIMDGLVGELDVRVIFKSGLEEAILEEMKKEKINIDKVTVAESKNGRTEVTIAHSQCSGRHICNEKIVKIVSRLLGKKMKRADVLCHIDNNEKCTLVLKEESCLKVAASVAAAVKENRELSGDSYSFMELSDGDYMLALSDGMGSGVEAREESRATIELLEQFAEVGFKKDMAIKLINSVLVLKSEQEKFATLDMCCINMYSGAAEFIKIGGATAFVIRNWEARAIRSSTLPIGMLKFFEMDKTEVNLKDGDIIVMLTDGVADVIDDGVDASVWLTEQFTDFKSSNPQDIADYILVQAKKKADYKIKDDMTVVAARIWGKTA